MSGLRRLSFEWTNRDDTNADAWIARMQAEIEERNLERLAAGKPLAPPVTFEEMATWRAHFRATREALERLEGSGLSWGQVVTLVLDKRRLQRRADNPEFIAALLFLLDRRAMSVQDLQALLDIPGGHLYRFLERGGVEWSASSGYMGRQAENGGLDRALGAYRSPLEGVAIVRGRVRRLPSGPSALSSLRLLEDDRPMPPPSWGRIGDWLTPWRKRRKVRAEPVHKPVQTE